MKKSRCKGIPGATGIGHLHSETGGVDAFTGSLAREGPMRSQRDHAGFQIPLRDQFLAKIRKRWDRDLEQLGGLVTKAVSLVPRPGAKAPRVSDFPGGMINAIGLANPGVAVVRDTELPWLAAHLSLARVIVNVVGNALEDFGDVVTQLDDAAGVSALKPV